MTYTAFNDKPSSNLRIGLEVRKDFLTRPEIIGSFGVVTSTNARASSIGLRVLEQGGNAFDAAVAVGLALNVLEPEYNGFGGEVVALARLADTRTVKVLCGQGVAPRTATCEQFLELGYKEMPSVGLLAATVPGAFDAWMLMLRDLGTMTLRAVLSPTMEICNAGVPLSRDVRRKLAQVATRFQGAGWEASSRIYMAAISQPDEALTLQNEDLSSTLSALLTHSELGRSTREEQIDSARSYFYKGPIGLAVASFSGRRSLSKIDIETGGLIERADLEQWKAHWEDPVTTNYKGWTVHKSGPWSQGPVMLEHLNVFEEICPNPAACTNEAYVHALIESGKIAFNDRDLLYGDPNFSEIPLEDLLSKTYAKSRAKEITDAATIEALTISYPDMADPSSDFYKANTRQSPGFEGDTCHFDIIDRLGNVVSATPSGGWLQDSPAIPKLGFSLNTRSQMFNLREGHPNALGPRKRPRTTLSPTIATHDGGRILSFGTPGADYQDQYNILLFLRYVVFGCSLQEAVESVSFRSEHFVASVPPYGIKPGLISIEQRFPEKDLECLRRRGHLIAKKPDYSMSPCTAAVWEGGILRAAAGPTEQRGYAVGL